MRYILSFMILFSQMEAKHPLSICCIFQNEAPYLKEWIEFHKIQGVKHFFLYNNNSEDDFAAVLAPYILSREVTLTEWPYTYTPGNAKRWLKIQHAAYMDCIKKFGVTSNWIAFIDSDEFLFCPNGESLVSFLKRYTDYGGVCANWLFFGTSNVQNIPEGCLMIELLTKCSLPDHERNHRIKSIVQPDKVAACPSAHFFFYKEPYFAVNANEERVDRMDSHSIIHDKIRINHYWSRTEQHFLEKKAPSRHNRREAENEENLRQRVNLYNLSSDTAILQFVPQLKQKMGL